MLRELRETDVEGMLEWMHDSGVQAGLQKPVEIYEKEDALRFIQAAKATPRESGSVHFAITDESDEYLGTISLKNFDLYSLNAEYAIVLRRKFQGKGIAKEATCEILEKAFVEYQLERVYLNVYSDHERAIKLYEKCGFIYEGEKRNAVRFKERFRSLKIYSILKEEFLKR